MAIRVLFVCLGNICRSPMAEAVFGHLVAEAGLEDQIVVDSVGTGSWHVGERPHRGTRDVLRRHGVAYDGRARQVTALDVQGDDTYIIAMDQSNLAELVRRFGPHPRLHRLLDFVPDVPERDVPDPYYSGNFDHVYGLVSAAAQALLAGIRAEHDL